jgi:2-amino-4-hydroxy-6-hydroxymethyldihydropteridine diphosphokinase
VGIIVVSKSSLYRSAPVDAGGDDYFNAVARVETTFTAPQLLRICQYIENQFGRERPFRNAPRTLDLDVLMYGSASINEPDLVIPHPRVTQRAFVLVPLVELNPDLVIPGHGRAADFLPAVAGQRIEKVKTCQCAGMLSPASS